MLESRRVPYERDTNRHLWPALPWDSRPREPFEAAARWVLCKWLTSC